MNISFLVSFPCSRLKQGFFKLLKIKMMKAKLRSLKTRLQKINESLAEIQSEIEGKASIQSSRDKKVQLERAAGDVANGIHKISGSVYDIDNAILRPNS